MPKKKTSKWSFKKIVYVVLTIILGKLLGIIAYGLLSLKFIHMLVRRGLPVEYDHIFGSVFSPVPANIFWLFVLGGAVGGFFMGLRWWQMIYVEHRHWKKWKKRGR